MLRFLLDGTVTGAPGVLSRTLATNILGSFALGALVAVDLPQTAALLAGTGFCGAFTTFSSFAVEVVSRADRGDARSAVRYAGVTLATTLAGVGAGVGLASQLGVSP